MFVNSSCRIVLSQRLKRSFGKRSIATESAREAYLEHLEGGISILKLNRPASRNALSVNLVTEFRQALSDVRFSRCDTLLSLGFLSLNLIFLFFLVNPVS